MNRVNGDLQQIPGVGKSIEEDLHGIGIFKVADLAGGDPETLYTAMCKKQGIKIDRCMLYVLRCAVYYASYKSHDPEKLKWWNWKEGSIHK